MVAVNIPAIYLASKKFDVISLFLVADIVCATSVFPVFLGLQTNDWRIFKSPTELGAFLGCIGGVATVLVNGVLNDAEGGVWEYFWLRNSTMCSLCGSKTMVSFIVTPAMSCILTYLFTFLDLIVRGERARQPIISVAFDTKLDSVDDEDSEEVIKVEEAAESHDADIGASVVETKNGVMDRAEIESDDEVA